jgi:CHAT domain-containing protein
VPDETLAPLPFCALRSEENRSLIEDFAIVVAPSGSVFARSALNPPPRAHRSILAVGNPQLNPESTVTLSQLPEAQIEAVAIGRLYPEAVVLTGAEATPKRFLDAVRHADIVHLGTHALLSPRDPWMSAIVLAGGKSDSGLLYLREIAAASFDGVDTVVLAGCRTGILAAGQGEIRSLAVAFLAAGSRSVIGTLWDVDDRRTRAISHQLHKALSNGVPAAAALRAAQLKMIRASDPELNAPSTWAPFQVLGSFR